MIETAAVLTAVKTGKFWLKAAPWIGCVVLAVAFGALWKWDAKTIDSLTSELTAMTDQRDLAAGDARRWQAFGETARAAVEARNAEIDAQRADLAQTEILLEQANQATAVAESELRSTKRKMEKLANEHPDQVRPLGPIAHDAGKLLRP